jgi:hypothetical protein
VFTPSGLVDANPNLIVIQTANLVNGGTTRTSCSSPRIDTCRRLINRRIQLMDSVSHHRRGTLPILDLPIRPQGRSLAGERVHPYQNNEQWLSIVIPRSMTSMGRCASRVPPRLWCSTPLSSKIPSSPTNAQAQRCAFIPDDISFYLLTFICCIDTELHTHRHCMHPASCSLLTTD